MVNGKLATQQLITLLKSWFYNVKCKMQQPFRPLQLYCAFPNYEDLSS